MHKCSFQNYGFLTFFWLTSCFMKTLKTLFPQSWTSILTTTHPPSMTGCWKHSTSPYRSVVIDLALFLQYFVQRFFLHIWNIFSFSANIWYILLFGCVTRSCVDGWLKSLLCKALSLYCPALYFVQIGQKHQMSFPISAVGPAYNDIKEKYSK